MVKTRCRLCGDDSISSGPAYFLGDRPNPSLRTSSMNSYPHHITSQCRCLMKTYLLTCTHDFPRFGGGFFVFSFFKRLFKPVVEKKELKKRKKTLVASDKLGQSPLFLRWYCSRFQKPKGLTKKRVSIMGPRHKNVSSQVLTPQ